MMEQFLKDYSGEKPNVGKYTFKFGKYKGFTYDEVYNNHKSYVAFLYQNLDKDKNKSLIEYIEQRVKEEYKPQVEGQ